MLRAFRHGLELPRFLQWRFIFMLAVVLLSNFHGHFPRRRQHSGVADSAVHARFPANVTHNAAGNILPLVYHLEV